MNRYRRNGFLLVLMLLLLMGCGKEKGQEAVNQKEESKETKATGVVQQADLNSWNLSFYDLAASMTRTWTFSKGTSIQNREGKEVSINRLIAGEVVDVVYDENMEKVTSIRLSNSVKRYEHVKHYTLDLTAQTLTTGTTNYRFDDNLVLASNNRLIDWLDISNVDELKLYYQEEKIVSVMVTTGHGTIRPTNYAGFIGGMVSVGTILARPITEDLVLIVPEGEYDVSMTNGTLNGTKSVSVIRDQEISLDMGEFKQTPENVGEVIFEIEPAGADLYLNGKKTEYDKPVTLNYGIHQVQVMLTGYETYVGKIDVKDANPTVSIHLAQEAEESPTPEVSQAPVTTPSAPATTVVPTTPAPSDVVQDTAHTITVKAPEGASVYLNGNLQGVAPVSFTKQIGTVTISLSKEGCETKSYLVEIANDDQNITWSFPALKASS